MHYWSGNRIRPSAVLSGLLSCARITVLGLNNGLVDQQYPHCDKGVAETTLIGGCGHIYAHGSGPDRPDKHGFFVCQRLAEKTKQLLSGFHDVPTSGAVDVPRQGIQPAA